MSDAAVSDTNKEVVSDGGNVETMHQYIQHVFEVVVEGIRDLSLFANTIWGEADCFVQYHFPKQLQQLEEDGRQQGKPSIVDDDIELHPYRTSTTLCTPDPSFSHETKHILTLPVDTPVQKALMACYRAGGMGIELWKRFYYPNIRDQLVAKVPNLIIILFNIVNFLSCDRQLCLLLSCVQLSQCGGQLLLVSSHSVFHLL